MKKIMLMALLVLFLPAVSANITGIDQECQHFGYDYGISRWDWTGNSFQEIETISGYSLMVSGDSSFALWNSDEDITGVLSHEVCNYQVVEGGVSGTINAVSSLYDIKHLTFCGDYPPEQGGDVPEFGTIAAFVILVCVGIYIHNKSLVKKDKGRN